MYFAKGVVVADIVAAKALMLMDPIPVDEGVQLLAAAPPELLFLAWSTAA
jgi:hypothetical protein